MVGFFDATKVVIAYVTHRHYCISHKHNLIMKHRTLLLVFVFIPLTLLAKPTAPDRYKQRMVKYVNKGSYERASQTMPYIKDWRFDATQKELLDVNQAFAYIAYADSMRLPQAQLDSFRLFLSDNLCALSWNIIDLTISQADFYGLEALKIKKDVLGEQHLIYARALESYGSWCHFVFGPAKAEPYYLDASKIYKSVLGELHPDYVKFLYSFGSLYSDLGDYAKAEQYYLEALKITKSVFGECHLDYAASLNNLGGLYSRIGDYGKAERYYLEALKIKNFF